MKKILFSLVAAGLLVTSAQAQIIITGIVDPDVDFNARAIEIYVQGTVDLADFTLQRAANSTPFDESFTNLSGTFTDQFVYITSDAAAFNTVFGISGANVVENGAITGTGNDAFRFVPDSNTSTVIDVVGLGGDNIYNDSYMYRNNGTTADTAWNASNWSIPGNGTLDSLDEAATAAAVPFGTYVIPEPSSFLLFGAGLGALAYLRRKK
jgi:hypothetical protein